MSDKLFSWSVIADKTDVSIPFRLLSTAGAAVTGKTATNLTLSYWRQGGTRTAITASDLAAVNSAHSDGGVKEVDATNLPGLYRLDLPDAAVASGADWVVIGVVCSGAMDYETWLPIQSAGTVEVYSRIGAPVGASISADIAGVQSDTDNIQTRIPAALVSGRMDASVGAMAANTLTASALATDAVTEIDTALSTAHGSGAWGAGGNGGALTLTYTLTSSVDSSAIQGAIVELYAEVGMVTLIDSQTTNALGVCTFSNLVAGTYYLKRIKSGWSFTNPDTEVVA